MSRHNFPKLTFLRRWRPPLHAGDGRIAIAVLVLTVVVPAAVSTLLVPLPMVLPVVSLWSLAVAAMIALTAWLRPGRRRPDQLSAWDLAGAFTLIGCAAAIIGEIEHMVEYLWSVQSRSQAHD